MADSPIYVIIGAAGLVPITLDSVNLTGIPVAPTAAPGTNTTQLATTAFVLANAGGGGAVSSVFSRTGAVTAQTGDYAVAQVTGAAPLASPALTGTPTAPTATVGTNTTQLATTAFVLANAGSTSPAGSSGQLQYNNAGAFGAVNVYREDANTVSQRNSTSPQTSRLYNTYDGTNNEWLDIGWSSNVCTIQTTKNGTGTVRALTFALAGSGIHYDVSNIGGLGHVFYYGSYFLQASSTAVYINYPNLFFTPDNTTDIGASGATRPRTGYFGTSVVTPLVGNGATGLQVGSAAADKVSFHGAAVVVQNTGWSTANSSSTKALDVSTATLGDVANFLATLAETLKTKGLIGA